MASYMKQLPALNGRKTVVFVTKGLPLSLTGGSGAIERLKKGVESKGGKVVGSGIVFWSNKDRENHIADVVGKLSSGF
jgi:hypothetical protein